MEGFIESGRQIFVNTLTLKKSTNWVTQLNWCHLVTISRWKFLNDKKCEETIYHLSSSCMGVNYYLVSFERRTLFLFSYCQKEPFQSSVWCFSWFLHMKMCHIWIFCLDHLDLRGNSVSVGLVREKTAHTVLSQYLVIAFRQTFSIRWMCITDLRTVLGF